MSDGRGHETRVIAALRRLGREPDPDSLTSRLLAGGLSGSSVHCLTLAGQAMVLKVTTPTADPHLMVRARREFLFYQHLARLVPVRVPSVLACNLDETEEVAILLAAYRPPLSPDDWVEASYLEVVQQLSRLHATYWDRTAVPTLPAWLPAKPHLSPAHCQDAAQRWRALGDRHDAPTVPEPDLRKLADLVLRIPALDPQMITLPVTLCHGDCHTGNLLRGPNGEWVWADWQDVRLGPGVDDLAFLWQRAFVAAATPPPFEAMVRAYGAGLMTVEGIQVTPEQLDRALAWSELRSWLVDWPGYLAAVSATRMERVLQRIDALTDQLELAGRRTGPCR